MARETWPCTEVVAAVQKVVFLAVHRHNDTEWTIRLNVLGYPQMHFLDGYGELLANGSSYSYARTKQEVTAAVEQFAGMAHDRPRVRKLTPELAALVPEIDVAAVTSWDCMVRTAAWRRVLPKCDAEQLAAVCQWETDPVVRLEALRAANQLVAKAQPGLPPAAAVLALARQAIADANDYVRQEAFGTLSQVGGEDAAKVLGEVIDSVLDGRSGFGNPNNMLCAAVAAAGKVADPAVIVPLANVLKQEAANNSATFLAVDALIAIGQRHGKDKVEAALRLALAVQGSGAERLHRKAKQALDG